METLTEINKVIWPFLRDNSPDLVPREQATRPLGLSEGGLGIVDIPDKVRSIGMRAIELFRATAVEYDRWKEKPCWIVLAEQRLEADINVAEILKNGWAWSRLDFKNGTKTNPQGFWECAAKALKYATGYTGESQDWLLKEWTARALYRWLRRKKDSGKFIKRVAAKWGLGEELQRSLENHLGINPSKQHNQRVYMATPEKGTPSQRQTVTRVGGRCLELSSL